MLTVYDPVTYKIAKALLDAARKASQELDFYSPTRIQLDAAIRDFKQIVRE